MSRFQRIFEEADEATGLGKSISLPQKDMSQFEAVYNQDETLKQLLKNQVVVSDLERLRSMIQKISLPRDDVDKYVADIGGSDPHQVVLGTYTKKLKFSTSDSRVLPLITQASAKQPYYNWEDEVRESMKLEESFSSSSEEESEGGEESRNRHKTARTDRSAHNADSRSMIASSGVFQRIHRFEVDIAPYRCFDTEYIDVDETKDPLDKIFHNYRTNYSHTTHHDSEEEKEAKLTPSKPTSEKLSAAASSSSPYRVKREGLFKRFNKVEEQGIDGATTFDNIFLSPDDEARQQKILRDKQRLEEKIQRIKGVSTWLDTSSSLIKNAPKRTRDIALHSRVPAMIAQFNHSNIALSHFNSRPDLKEIDLKYFHRPRMLKERDRPWQITLKQKTSMNRKLKGGQNELGKIVLAEEDKQNLSLVYQDNTFILVEYIEEFPPVMLNYGMASSIINYFRSSNETAQELDEAIDSAGTGNSSSNSPSSSAFLANFHKRKMARTSSKNETALEAIKKQLQESDCRLPRHVLLLWELNNTKRSYEHDANVPRQKIGSNKVLSPEDASPFLGNIEVGELQKSLENNLFRAPLFEHPVSPTDFLLIRTKTSTSQLSFSIREIPHIFLSGQLEPQVVVPRPHYKYSAVQEKFFLLAIVRALQSHINGMNYQEIFDTVLKYSSKETLAPHKFFIRQHFRDLLKRVADEIRENGNLSSSVTLSRWFAKEFADTESENAYSADTLAKNFSPEDVCIMESSSAAEYRLLQSNITDIELMKVQVYLHFLHSNKQYQRERLENLNDFVTELANKLNYGSSASSTGLSKEQIHKMMQSTEKLKKLFIQEIHRTDVKQSIARFVLERLITAPWNTTDAFYNSVIKGDNNGKMNVRGKGDPSGTGEGFAYVRLPNVQPTLLTADALKKKKEEEKEKNKLVGTDKDLRSLTKGEAIALLVRFKVDKEEAKKLGRWDRIHMIRSFVNELARKGALNEDEKGLIKFARDPALMSKMRKGADAAGASSGIGGLDIATEEFKKICDEIWNRQKAALSERVPPSQLRQHHSMVMSPTHRASREAKRREKKLRRQESLLGSPRGSLKRSRSQGEDDDSEEDTESDEDSDESDLAEDIEKALSSRTKISNRLEASKSQSTTQHEQDRLEYQSFNSMLDKNSSSLDPANNSSSNMPNKEKKKKIMIGISGGGNDGTTPRASTMPVDAVSNSDHNNNPAAAATNTAAGSSVGSKLSALAQLHQSSRAYPSDFVYPTRVVKRITRVTQVDGEETIKVEFIFADTEVQRIQAIAERAKRDRMERRTMTALSHHPYCNKQRGSDGNYLDSDDDLANNPTMSLQVGKIRQTIDHHNQVQTIQSNLPLSKKEKQLTIKTQKGKQQLMKDEEMEFISKAKSTKRSSLSEYYSHPRLPKLTFAIRLEKEIMKIWNKKEYELFLYPVDRSLYPQYYTIVSQPICLADIREKITRYQYESLEQFLGDLRLMAENSEKFNGKASPITDLAKKIYLELKLSVDHEKQMVKHPQVDFWTKTEEAMRQKKAYFRRGLHDLAGVGGGPGMNSSSSAGYSVNPNVIGGGIYR